MRKQIAVALMLACATGAACAAPAAAALEFYVRIQGPKPVSPAHGVRNGSLAHLSFESDVPATIGSGTKGAGSGKMKFGEITITREAGPANALSAAIAAPQLGSSPPSAPATLVHQVVAVGCSAFDVQADFGKGPVKGALAGQSVDGVCIYAIPMTAAAQEAIVRVGLPDTPPGWSFNSQPQSKCVRSGETLDGTLAESQDIFSFMWSAHAANAMLPQSPCTKP